MPKSRLEWRLPDEIYVTDRPKVDEPLTDLHIREGLSGGVIRPTSID